MTRDEVAPMESRARWQHDRLALLAELIESGVSAGLPTLDWTVSDLGLIRADVPAGTPNPGAVFHAWAGRLGAEQTAHSVYGGWVHLRATARKVFGTSVMVRLHARSLRATEVNA